MKRIVALLLLMAPLAANAGIIRYDFAGMGAGGASGYMDFDDSAAGPGNILGSIVGWSFTWSGETIDDSISVLTGGTSFIVDAALNYVAGGFFCVSAGGNCDVASAPTFAFQGDVWRMTSGGMDSGVQDGVMISGPTRIPEPATLALLSAGLLAFGLRRRRN